MRNIKYKNLDAAEYIEKRLHEAQINEINGDIALVEVLTNIKDSLEVLSDRVTLLTARVAKLEGGGK